MLCALEDYLGDRTDGPLFVNRDETARLAYTTSYALIRREMEAHLPTSQARVHRLGTGPLVPAGPRTPAVTQSQAA